MEHAIEFMFSNQQEWHQLRQVTLHPDYPKTKFEIQQHFVVSKAGYPSELNNSNISRVKKQQLLTGPEHER
jgi:hypothetical protein